MPRIVLSLALYEGFGEEQRHVVLYREVQWPSVPPDGAYLTFGRYGEDDKETGNSCLIRRVFFAASGEVSVEAEAENLRDEFEDTVAHAKRDGFMEWEEWRKHED